MENILKIFEWAWQGNLCISSNFDWDPNKWLKWYNEQNSDEESFDDKTDSERDHVSESNHDSHSEQETLYFDWKQSRRTRKCFFSRKRW